MIILLGGRQSGSLFPCQGALASLVINEVRPHQAVVGCVHLWQHIYRSFVLFLFFWVLLLSHADQVNDLIIPPHSLDLPPTLSFI
jgi:hypothetical protein